MAAMKNEKQIMIVVQAAPKTQPGGVHGALFKPLYQSPWTASPVTNPPKPSAAKFNAKKSITLIQYLPI